MDFWFTRIFRMALTLFVVVTLTFILLRTSYDPVVAMLGPDATDREIEIFRIRWNLDKSLLEQYLTYLGNALAGDFGDSFRDGRPVFAVIGERFPYTLWLGSVSYIFAIVIGIPAGILAALYRGSVFDRMIMVISVVGFALPNFFLGILMILLFSLVLQVLPSSGASSWAHIIMPAFALGLTLAGILARFTRSAMLEVLSKTYMLAAQAKGISPVRRALFHALPNAALSVITIMGLILGNLVAGTVVVETVFAWPGIGRLLVTSISQKDLAVVQALVFVIAGAMVMINLTVDLSYRLLDPRTRKSS